MTKKSKVPQIRFKGFSGKWEEKALEEIVDRYDNLRIPISASNRIAGDTPYYGANGIQDYVQGFTHDGEFILVAEDGANDLKNYPVQYVNGKIWVNNHAHVLQAKKDISSTKFLKYSISKINIEPFLVGGGRAKLNANIMMKINIYVPLELQEQQKIGSYFQKLDKLIQQKDKKYQKLKQFKKAMLDKMFPKNEANTPEIRFKGFSGKWESKELGTIMDVTSVKRIHQSDWTNSGIRFLRARDIVADYKKEDILDYLYISEEKYNQYSLISGKVKQNDLLVTGVGTIGIPMLIKNDKPIYFKDGNIIWFKNENYLDGYFFYYSFINKTIQNYIKLSAGTGTVGTYTIESGKKTPIKIPKKAEQTKIGDYFQKLDNQIDLQQKELEKLKNIKKASLSKMFV